MPSDDTLSPGANVDMCVVVEFDHRSDNGPRLVGPFTSKAAAQDWLEWQTFDYEADFAEVEKP